MTDIPEGLVEAVARAMMDVCAPLPAGQQDGKEVPILCSDPDFDDLPSCGAEGTEDDYITQEAVMRLARCAILAHNAWLTANDERIKAFVAFQGPNPMEVTADKGQDFYAWKGKGPEPRRWTAPDGTMVYRDYSSYVDD